MTDFDKILQKEKWTDSQCKFYNVLPKRHKNKVKMTKISNYAF